jgi:membrane protein required for colicin V production
MNWLDIILGIILVASVVRSFRKGLSREVIGLVAVVLALLFGTWFYGAAGAFLLSYVSSPRVANFAGFCLVFAGVMLLGGLVSYTAGKFLRVTGLSMVDHALGAVFGLLRGTVVAVALVMGMMAFSQNDKPPAAVVDSRLAPYVVDAARLFASMAPHELKDGFRKSYAQVREAWSSALGKGIRGAPIPGAPIPGSPIRMTPGGKKKDERQI